ncbi:hypothetical protein P8452_33198 [Trifolium repens]|nr:hypothetical protein P8452_33198 [Trifolium repens]
MILRLSLDSHIHKQSHRLTVTDEGTRIKKLLQLSPFATLSLSRISLKLSQHHIPISTLQGCYLLGQFDLGSFCHPIYLTEGDVLSIYMIWNNKETMTKQGSLR